MLMVFGAFESIFMFFTEEKQFSDLYQIIMEIVRYNKEKDEKLVILNNLQVSLQKYFDQLSLTEFKKLKLVPSDGVGSVGVVATPTPSITTPSKQPPDNGTVLKP